MQIYIVQEQQSEGGWGYCGFDAEAYFSEQKAEDRCKQLNKEKGEHCGYYFSVIPATIIDKPEGV